MRPDDVAAVPLRALVDRTGLDPARADDVILGCANQAGEDSRNVARIGRRGERYGMAAMCIGVGQGIAMIVEHTG